MLATDITDLSKELRVEVFVPEGRSHCNVIQPNQPLTALINLRPYFTFNTIHYSLFQRIGRMAELGFNVTVLFYDRTVLYGELSPEIATENDIARSMDHVFMALRRYGINMNNIEILSESVLWRSDGFAESFPRDIMRLTYLCADDVVFNSFQKHGTKLPSHIFDVILGMLYEKILQPDFVFFAGEEADVWRQARNRKTLMSVFSNDLMPPVILKLDNLCNIDGTGTLSSKEGQDPFSDKMSFDQACNAIRQAAPVYLSNIEDLNLIYRPIKGLPIDVVINYRKRMYGEK